jgi:CheY-like chemotaxis protein
MKALLITEDGEFLTLITERLLSQTGYSVISATYGDEAITAAREQRPDLVILDMLPPTLSGLDILNKLRSGSITSQIPVIVLSGMSQRNEQKLRRAGATGFLNKSLLFDGPDPLFDLIDKTLAQSSGLGVHSQRDAVTED